MSFLVGESVEPNSMHDLLELGHSLIAEINRLSDVVPTDFVNPSSSKFKPLMLDFAYFGDLSVIDNFIDANEQGVMLEDEFYFSFGKVIKRFGALFDSLASFFSDVVELSKRNHSSDPFSFHPSEADLQQRLIKAEILYVTGILLILFDEKFLLSVKQRLFVAYYRSNPASNERYDLLVDLMKTKPSSFEQLFNTLPVNKQFASSVVTSVRSDGLFVDEHELYNDSLYETRVTRSQRTMLFICLCFTPSVLHSDYITMRQIVDMYFSDTWVLSLHLGLLINVINAWENCKAANTALQQCITINSAKKLAASNVLALKRIVFPHPAKSSSDDFTKCHMLIAAANLHLRWIILHSYRGVKSNKRANQLCDAVWSQLGMSSANLFNVLLQIANFEYILKEQYRNALTKKVAKFDELKNNACQHLSQMASLFSNDIPFQKIKKNLKLQKWLLLVEKTLSELNVSSIEAPSLIEHLKERIKQVSDIHDLSGNIAVDQYLQSISILLSDLLHCCMLNEEFLSRLDIVSDFSYGWTVIDQWSNEMEALVERDPLLIRSLFVKLSVSIGRTLTAIENPVRVSAISLCYSKQLEARLRKIIQVVPRSLFVLLDRISALLDYSLKSCVLKTDLRHFADPERRLNLAADTYAISTLSLSISTMQLTWIGSLRIDPSTLLLDGIKRELVSRISSHIYKELSAASEVSVLLSNLKLQINRLHDAFIYMCEHMGLNGALVWQSELTRVIGYMLEKESNRFLKHMVNEEESEYQSKSVTLPVMPEIAGSVTPLGRLYNLYLKCSDPRNTRYVKSMRVWCDLKTKKPLLSQESFTLAQDALSSMILTALDRIACFHIVKDINTFCDLYSKIVGGSLLQSLLEIGATNEVQIAGRFKYFDVAVSKITQILPPFSIIFSRIGQHQLLRQRILSAIKSNVNRNSSNVATAVETLQKGILHELRTRSDQCNGFFFSEITDLLQQCGITDPHQKKYVKKECPAALASTAFIVLIAAAPVISGAKRSDPLDLNMFSAGVACLLNQFDVIKSFFTLANMYFTSAIVSVQVKPAFTIIPALRLIAEYCLMKPEDLEVYIPTSLREKT